MSCLLAPFRPRGDYTVNSCPDTGLRSTKQTANTRHSATRSLTVRKDFMNHPTTSTVIGARVAPEHAQQLKQIADRNASTVSRTVARIIAERLDGTRPKPTTESA